MTVLEQHEAVYWRLLRDTSRQPLPEMGVLVRDWLLVESTRWGERDDYVRGVAGQGRLDCLIV